GSCHPCLGSHEHPYDIRRASEAAHGDGGQRETPCPTRFPSHRTLLIILAKSNPRGDEIRRTRQVIATAFALTRELLALRPLIRRVSNAADSRCAGTRID